MAERGASLQRFVRQSGQFSLGRLVVFLLAAAAGWMVFQGKLDWPVLFVPLGLFGILVALQARFDRRIQLVRRAIAFYQRGLDRISNTWQQAGEQGQRFADPHHPYAIDLDLFGRGSMFHLLCTARTRGGEDRLAAWLLHPANAATVAARQGAVRELMPLLDWREELAVLGEDLRVALNSEALSAWASRPPQPFRAWQRAAALVLAILGFSAICWFLATNLTGLEARIGFLAAVLLEALFAVPLRVRVLTILGAIDEPAAGLELLAELLASVERQSFESEELRQIRARILCDGKPASQRIAGLKKLKDILDSRDNVFVRTFGPILLWTTQTAMALEAWRAENGAFIPGWLDALSELEALSSLANYAFENPLDPFPEFVDGPPQFIAKGLAHPLLPRERAVSNSVKLGAPAALYVVSGSNMSGKSTLLRSIGLNAVLALCGAPVRAVSLTLTPLSLGASIRTADSLEEGHSRFMAEILRLKQVLELPSPALFLLDELLGGTNSRDRAVGSEGLIRALLERGAIGLVTTHDLSLSRVADELSPAARNVHFADHLEHGRLVFDYKMHDGVVTGSNALELMRAVGLRL